MSRRPPRSRVLLGAPSGPEAIVRPSTRAVGNAAEARAALLLEDEGYRVLARNVTVRGGELDLIADDRGVLCFIEVRSRRSDRLGHPLETINRAKRRRITLAARRFLAANGLEDRPCRFDVVTLCGDDRPELLRDAFFAED